MIELTTLIVLVSFIGGPHSAEIERPLNAAAGGSVIEVTRAFPGPPGTPPELVGMSRMGELAFDVESGTFTVTARVGPGTRPCDSGPRVVTIPPGHASPRPRHRRGQRPRILVRPHPVRLHLFCGIP